MRIKKNHLESAAFILIAFGLFLVVVQSAQAINITQNLIGVWEFETNCTDATVGEQLKSYFTPTLNTTVFKVGAASCSFDGGVDGGSNDYLELAGAPLSNMQQGSISFWVKQKDEVKDYNYFYTATRQWRMQYLKGATDAPYAYFPNNTTLVQTVTTGDHTNWFHYVMIFNFTNGLIYVNGALDKNITSVSALSTPSTQTAMVFAKAGTADYLTGEIDQLAIWNKSLNSTEIAAIYNGGAGTNYANWSNYTDNGNATTYFALTASNGTGSLTTFNATINGTTYSTINGTIQTTINQSIGALVNISANTAQHLGNTSTNIDTSANFQITLYPTLTLTAKDIYNASALLAFNATINGQLYQTSAGFVRVNDTTNTTATVSVAARNYFGNNTTTDNNGTFAIWATPYTLLRAYAYTGAQIVNFTVSYTGQTWGATGTLTGTNGTAYAPFYNDTYETNFYDAQNTNRTYAQLWANISAVTYLQAYNASPFFTNNSIRITIRNELTNQIINTTNVTVILSSDTYEQTNTTGNGTLYVDDLRDATYYVKFNASGYGNRTYAVTVTDQSTQTLDAYLGIGTESTILYIIDSITGLRISGATISVSRVINGTYTLVESKLSDVTGAAQITYTAGARYRISVTADDYDDKAFILDPILFSSYDIKLSRSTGAGSGEAYDQIGIVLRPSSYNDGESVSFSFDITSPTGALSGFGYTVTYPNGEISNSSTNANGAVLTGNFTPNANSRYDTVNITYYYTTSAGGTKYFNASYILQGASTDGTIASITPDNYGLSLFDSYLITTLVVVMVAGSAFYFAGALGGAVVGVLVLGLFYYIGFISIWALAIPALMVFVLVSMRGANG